MTLSQPDAADAWHLITCEYPPTVGGVSDYSHTLAAALAESRAVHVWCPPGRTAPPVTAGVAVHPQFTSFSPMELWRAGARLNAHPGPRRLFVQWVPQGFGYRSLNVGFALWVAARAWWRRDEVHLMVHEPFLPWLPNPVHSAVSLVHRLMLAIAGSGAARIWLSTSTWKERIRPYVRRRIPVEWLPVPAPSLPVPAPSLPAAARQRATQPGGGGPVVGHFGTHSSLVTAILAPALDVILRDTPASILLVGQGSDTFGETFLRTRPQAAARVRATGVLAPESVAQQLRTCDLMVQPYPDGVTTRRTSTLTLLALGLPVVTNAGHLSEPFWKESGAVNIVSAPDGQLLGQAVAALLAGTGDRETLAARARDLYDQRFASRHAVALLNAASWPGRHAA
ncbi:MAG TPA: glycosyltransferase [Candidatus Binatia bacterium]|nr:glycosyltransferase [Candidatus Binatia bacterium]